MMRSLIALMVMFAMVNAQPWNAASNKIYTLPLAGISLPGGIAGSTPAPGNPLLDVANPQSVPTPMPMPVNVAYPTTSTDSTLAAWLNSGKSMMPAARTFFFGSEPFCSTRTSLPDSSWTVDNKQSQYKSTFTGETKLCRQPFWETCVTFTGVVPCNTQTHRCINVPDSLKWDDSVLHPEYTSRIVQRPQVCVSKGIYMAPDAAVLFVAQVMFSWVLLTLGFVAVLNAVGTDRGTLLMKVVAGLVYVPIVLLLFSYYYLNAILGAAVTYASYQLFCRKRAEATAFGFVFLFLALYWVTFANGLGYMQHQSRLVPPSGLTNLARDYTYENFCEGYYRAFFTNPREMQGDFDNPMFQTRQYCDRRWLSAELFFMILLELGFLLAALVGGAAIFAPEPEKVVETIEMVPTRA